MNGIYIAVSVIFICCIALILVLNKKVEEYNHRMIHVAMEVAQYKDWADKTLERLDKRIEDNATGLKALNEAHCTMQKKFEEIDDLTAESLKAQIDADKAWADGVRALSSYGANIPSIKPGGLNNE